MPVDYLVESSNHRMPVEYLVESSNAYRIPSRIVEFPSKPNWRIVECLSNTLSNSRISCQIVECARLSNATRLSCRTSNRRIPVKYLDRILVECPSNILSNRRIPVEYLVDASNCRIHIKYLDKIIERSSIILSNRRMSDALNLSPFPVVQSSNARRMVVVWVWPRWYRA